MAPFAACRCDHPCVHAHKTLPLQEQQEEVSWIIVLHRQAAAPLLWEAEAELCPGAVTLLGWGKDLAPWQGNSSSRLPPLDKITCSCCFPNNSKERRDQELGQMSCSLRMALG